MDRPAVAGDGLSRRTGEDPRARPLRSGDEDRQSPADTTRVRLDAKDIVKSLSPEVDKNCKRERRVAAGGKKRARAPLVAVLAFGGRDDALPTNALMQPCKPAGATNWRSKRTGIFGTFDSNTPAWLSKELRKAAPIFYQNKSSYVVLEVLGAIVGLLGTSAAGGRWYEVDTSLQYEGGLAFKCASKLSFRVYEDQVARYTPQLQSELLRSYMDLRMDEGKTPTGLRLEMALLPLVGAIAHAEISVVARREISIQARRIAGATIPEDVVDELYSTMVLEGERLKHALADIEAPTTLD